MAEPHDVSLVLVQVSAAIETPVWQNIWGVTSRSSAHGAEGTVRRRIFGSVTPISRLGDTTDTYDLEGLLDMSDTDGQNVLRTARDTRVSVMVRFLPSGLGTGNPFETQECLVTEYGDDADAEGDFVECSFSLEGIGVLTRGVLA